jgi:choice-of-anchor B domain-containing protein
MNIYDNCSPCLKTPSSLTMLVILFLGIGIQTHVVIAQGAYRYEKVGHWNDTNLVSQNTPFSNAKQTWSDLMGWTDVRNNRKYIIMGSIDSIYFFDITNPDSIRKCDVFWGKNRVINRDIEVYQHYAYCVSDNGPDGAFQLFDLQYLPDSVRLVREDTTISRRTHSLFIDSVSKRMYMNSTNSSFAPGRDGMQIFSLQDPENPTYLGRLEDINGVCGRVHEAYFRNDTAYCSCEYNGLQIFDLRNINNQIHLGGITPPYPFNGYNHTSWLSDNGKHLVFTDELPYGLPIKLYDVSDVRSPDYILNFNSNTGATPHNVIWIGNKLFTSAYEDGMWVWDMTDINAPTVYGYYDTYPENEAGFYGGLSGCWGVYPFFNDGVIAASDMTNGLFLLKYNQQVSVPKVAGNMNTTMLAYPNPFEDAVNVSYSGMQSELVYYKLFNVQGKIIAEGSQLLVNGNNKLIMQNINSLTSGMYFLQLTTPAQMLNQTLIKQ